MASYTNYELLGELWALCCRLSQFLLIPLNLLRKKFTLLIVRINLLVLVIEALWTADSLLVISRFLRLQISLSCQTVDIGSSTLILLRLELLVVKSHWASEGQYLQL